MFSYIKTYYYTHNIYTFITMDTVLWNVNFSEIFSRFLRSGNCAILFNVRDGFHMLCYNGSL